MTVSDYADEAVLALAWAVANACVAANVHPILQNHYICRVCGAATYGVRSQLTLTR